MPLIWSSEVQNDLMHFQPSLIHVTNPDFVSQHAITWAKERGIPVIGSFHTRYDLQFKDSTNILSSLFPLLTFLQLRFYGSCDAVVTPSVSIAKLLSHQFRDVSIWSRGVDQQLFSPSKRDLKWRRTLQQKSDLNKTVIGFVGRMVMEKGLLPLTRILKRCHSLISVVFVGDGPCREWLAQQLRCLPPVFLGHLEGEQFARAVASLDIFVTASMTETFGQTTLEAMACGVPVVAMRAPGSQDLVVDGVTGRLVGNEREFVDAIEVYCRDPLLRRRHGNAGEKRSRKFSWDACHEQLLKKYRHVIDNSTVQVLE